VVDTIEAYTNNVKKGRTEQKLANDKTNFLRYIKSSVSNTSHMFLLNPVFNF